VVGDGGGYNSVDYGQLTVNNKCEDPRFEGGALRAQDFETPDDPLSPNGSILRLDPDTGLAAAGNPINKNRHIAYGLRNPFRFTIRPNTKELWIGDVGWATWEEINVLHQTGSLPLTNFQWPCYEGEFITEQYHLANLPICERMYADRSFVKAFTRPTKPFFTYKHFAPVLPWDPCRADNTAIAGIVFLGEGFGPEYRVRSQHVEILKNHYYSLF